MVPLYSPSSKYCQIIKMKFYDLPLINTSLSSVNFSYACIICAAILETMMSGGFEVSFSI